MSPKYQSDRLSEQQEAGEGVKGIFGTEAKFHDAEVAMVAHWLFEEFAESYPQLRFQHRVSISKKEINEALQRIDPQLGQTLFVPESNIRPDGGIIEVLDDYGSWRVLLISEAKHQGKDIENIKKEYWSALRKIRI